jgi:hypothetical protein
MKKNVAGQRIGAQLVSASDGSAFTGSVTVSVCGDAGTQATGSVGSGACTHEGNGYHTYAPAQAETNFDLIAFTFTGSGAVPVTVQVYTRPTTGLLAPTVDGRTLDVSAAGEAGIDLANVGSPTTALNLSGTTIKTATDVEADTADIQARIPAALVSGRIDASVGSMAANTLTAAAVASDAVAEIQSGLATQTSVDDLPTNAELATALAGSDDATLSAIAAEAVKTAAIKVKTDNLPTDPADASDIASAFSVVNGTLATLATAANLAIVAGYLDTEIAALTNAVADLPTNSELATALAPLSSALTTIDDLLDTEIAAIKTVTDKLNTTMVLDGGVYQFTVNALENGPSGAGGGGSATLANQQLILAKLAEIKGPGDQSWSISVRTASDVPIAGCECWVTTDLAGNNAITDIQRTDANGVVEFLLDPGTYYLFRRKSGVTFTNPQSFTVT